MQSAFDSLKQVIFSIQPLSEEDREAFLAIRKPFSAKRKELLTVTGEKEKYLYLQRVEDHLQQAIGLFQNLPERELLQPSSTGGWSIAQCLDHLNSYGHYYLPKIQEGMKKSAFRPSKDTFKSSGRVSSK